MEAHYRHIRLNGKLIATQCIIYQEPEKAELSPVGTGFALCSDKDNFSRKTGRELSYRRAMKAILSKRDSLPIRRKTTATKELTDFGNLFKSQYWTFEENE